MSVEPRFPIASSDQQKAFDRHTMLSEPIPSLDLMERACMRMATYLRKKIPQNTIVTFICGPGNNGGDGLCLARLFHHYRYPESVILVPSDQYSVENKIQQELLEKSGIAVQLANLNTNIHPDTMVIIDALYGSGLNKALDGVAKALVDAMNLHKAKIISIDSPTGIGSWGSYDDTYVHAQQTLALGSVSPSMLNRDHSQSIKLIDIGLDTLPMPKLGYYLNFMSEDWVSQLLPKVERHAHKGSQGHVLLIGGNRGMSGAIALAAKAAHAAGAGNVSVCSQPGTLLYLSQHPNIQYIESQFSVKDIENIPMGKYRSIGIGPGLGVSTLTTAALSQLLNQCHQPLVLDADALNIIAQSKPLLHRLPLGSILTPHPLEFERLFGGMETQQQRWKYASEFAREHGVHILAKDTYSVLFTADGEIYANGTGSSKLAQGGSGDTLTGLICGFLAQGLESKHAAICGMFYLEKYR